MVLNAMQRHAQELANDVWAVQKHVQDMYWAADPTYLLDRLRELELKIKDVRAVVVAERRNQGVSWTRIGEELGMTRQAAWERYSD